MSVDRKQTNIYETLKGLTSAIQNVVLKVGWVSEKRYPDSDMTTAEVGAIAESGSEKNKIPKRQVVQPALKEKNDAVGKLFLNESKKILGGSQTVEGAYDKAGQLMSSIIRRNISNLTSPPLKPGTIRARELTLAGRRKTRSARKKQLKKRLSSPTLAKPLVFHKHFLNSCTYFVGKE